MDETERIELREWAARVMGYIALGGWWVVYITPCDMWPEGCHDHIWQISSWTPDTNLNQTFMVVERMKELGWMIKILNNVILDFKIVLYGVDFFNDQGKRVSKGHENLAIAILLAAKATGN